jgi:hypothetical protein
VAENGGDDDDGDDADDLWWSCVELPDPTIPYPNLPLPWFLVFCLQMTAIWKMEVTLFLPCFKAAWLVFFFPVALRPDSGSWPPLKGLRDHTHTTLGRALLDEWSARRRDLYLTRHNTHKRKTSMRSAGFKPAISASEPSQTHALDRASNGIGTWLVSDIVL